MTSHAEAYILLGLRLGRHVDGLVDAYYGPPGLKEQVDAEPLFEPAALAAEGDALIAELDDGWLRDQLIGLRTYAGQLAGEEISYPDEVERCYGVRPARQSTDVYREAHERLAELLPGEDALVERYQAWRRSCMVPAELVVPALQDAAAELRSATTGIVDLPAARRSWSRRSRASRGGRSTTTWAGFAAGWPSTSTYRRPATRSSTWPRTRSTPATTRSTRSRSSC